MPKDDTDSGWEILIKQDSKYKEWYELIKKFEKKFPDMYVSGFDPDFMLRYRDEGSSPTVFISKRFMKTILEKLGE